MLSVQLKYFWYIFSQKHLASAGAVASPSRGAGGTQDHGAFTCESRGLWAKEIHLISELQFELSNNLLLVATRSFLMWRHRGSCMLPLLCTKINQNPSCELLQKWLSNDGSQTAFMFLFFLRFEFVFSFKISV